MLEIIITSCLFLIPLVISLVTSKIYNVPLGFITYILFSYFFMKILDKYDMDFLKSINALEMLNCYKSFINLIIINPCKEILLSFKNEEIYNFLSLDIVKYSLIVVIYGTIFVFSCLLRKKRIKNYKKLRS